VTIIILVIAFGSLVAAGSPPPHHGGLLVAAGALVITTKFTPVSIWALNFALMFALALGIDYALFLVMRFRSALERRNAQPGDREAIVARWPRRSTPRQGRRLQRADRLARSPPSSSCRARRSDRWPSGSCCRHRGAGCHPDLLPAVLGKLGTNINKGRIRLRRGPRPEARPLDRMLHRWGRFLWRHPFPPARRHSSCCSLPQLRSSACGPICPRSPSCRPAPTLGRLLQVTGPSTRCARHPPVLVPEGSRTWP